MCPHSLKRRPILSSIRWPKQLIHDYVILSGQHCPRLSAKMQPRLVNGSTVLANTNALDEKSARTGDAVRAPGARAAHGQRRSKPITGRPGLFLPLAVQLPDCGLSTGATHWRRSSEPRLHRDAVEHVAPSFESNDVSGTPHAENRKRDREILWGGRRGSGNFVAASNRWSAACLNRT